MPTFAIHNFGCRATEADAAALRHELLARGLGVACDAAHADVIILNTCTVTAAADAQTRDALRKMQQENARGCFIVTGCYAQRAPEEVAALPGVSFVVGNSHQAQIPDLIQNFVSASGPSRGDGRQSSDFVPLDRLMNQDDAAVPTHPPRILSGDISRLADVQLAPAALLVGDRTRPVVKIQDGCNNRCSYCVIPSVRGKSRSLPPDQVIGEVRALVSAGAKEGVLSGINLGSYGRDLQPRQNLLAVTQRILGETELERLRFSSIEPQDVTEELVSLVAFTPRIARHFHIPLQSGCDGILKAMHRWYRTAHYAQRVERIRQSLPDAAIGADVIVGFPGETDQDFQSTVDFIRNSPLTYLHVFSFSERPGTKAAALGARVPGRVIRERARSLRSLSGEKQAAFRSSQQGRHVKALTLATRGENWTEAISGNYLKIKIRGFHVANRWQEVILRGDLNEIVEPGGAAPDRAPAELAEAR